MTSHGELPKALHFPLVAGNLGRRNPMTETAVVVPTRFGEALPLSPNVMDIKFPVCCIGATKQFVDDDRALY